MPPIADGTSCGFFDEFHYKSATTAALRGRPRPQSSVTFPETWSFPHPFGGAKPNASQMSSRRPMNVAMTRMVLPRVSLVLEPVDLQQPETAFRRLSAPHDEAVGGVGHAGG